MFARARRRRRGRRAIEGEEQAEALLSDLGYRVEARQARVPWRVEIDGRQAPVELRADYLVRRRGRRFVADVKTGKVAPSLSNAGTRRQLLEYRLAYDVDGVLLVDMEEGRVHQVRFPDAGGSGRWLVWLLFALFGTVMLAMHR